MRRLSLFTGIMLIACFQSSLAQDIFKQHGFDKKPLTLSDGSYNEFFNNDEVVQIGTVLLNTKTNKVVAFVEEDTVKTSYLAEFSSRWLSIDPLAAKYPQFSPYVYVENNPIKMIDPNGCSGEVVIDRQNRTLTVTANIILYGSAGNASLATSTARDVQNQWNASNGTTSIGGVDYKVNFVVNGTYNSNLTANEITGNTDIKNNFFKVVESGVPISSADGVGSNTGVFLKSNISKDGSTTESHEMGHTWGAVKGTADGHPVNKDLRGKGQPGMMYARGTIVDSQYQYDPNAVPGAIGGTVNPDKRKVDQQDINYLELNNLNYDQNGKAKLGSLSNIAH
jgi:hypothetical protein